MKNLFFSAIILGAAFVSCAENETSVGGGTTSAVGDGDLVSINVYAGTTKGVDTDTSTLEGSTVELHIDDSGTISKTYTFTCTDSDWSQSASELMWSDIVFPANFYSLHDGTAFNDLTFTDGVATYRSYTVTGDSSAHNDLVFHASKLESIPVGGMLSAYHKHALSKIHLYAGTDDYIVYIAKATLCNVDGEATVTITPLASDADASDVGATWDSASADAESGFNGDSYQYYYVGDETPTGLTIDDDGADPLINTLSNAPMMIIPQTTTPLTAADVIADDMDNTYIEVIYYMTNASGNPLVGYSSVSVRSDASLYNETDIPLYVKAAFPLSYTFEANKEYNITLGLGEDNTTGGILVNDYYVDKDGEKVILTLVSDDSETTIEIPDIDEGENILSNVESLIDITVTANLWSGDNSLDLEYTGE